MTETFIRRPVMTTLVMSAILLFGAMSYTFLPVNDLPNVDFPTMQVSASVPGASPETMASSVATPLERQFSTISGLDSMSSSSTLGSTQITLQFNLSRDIDAAAQDVQAAIAKAQRQLPDDMPSPPSYSKVNPADTPILFLALSSPVLPLSKVDEFADTYIAQRISTIPGVAQVQINGSQKYAVRIQIDPNALASRGIGIDEVADAIRDNNVNLPTGRLDGRHQAYTIRSNGQLLDADGYRSLIVAYRSGAPVRLGELADVTDSVENNRIASWYKGTRAIVLTVLRQPGANTVAVVDSILEVLPTIRQSMPAALELNILSDRSQSIRESVNDVQFTLVLTSILVVLVIFLFLRNVSATIIPSLALPLSVIGAFAVMYLCGFTLDNLSLMALTLSVGFIVDDAIVMLENIVRRMEGGEGVLEASLKGSREIGFTIVSMTLSLAAVFIPILFMGGILGRLLHEFAITIMAAILLSGVVSLTLTPMLTSRFMRHPSRVKHGAVYRGSEKIFDGMRFLYSWSLRGVLRHRFITLVLSLVLVAATVYLFNIIPKGFIPSEDTGRISGTTEAVQGISFESMVEHQKAAMQVVMDHPDIAAFMSSVGGGSSGSSGNTGRLFMRLKSRHERTKTVDEIISDLRPKLSSIPGLQVYLQNPPSIRIGGQSTRSLYQFSLQSPNTDELFEYATQMESRLKELPGIVDVATDLQMRNPQANVFIDRDKAAALGVSAMRVEQALQSAYGSRQVTTIYAANNDYNVIMELKPEFQSNTDSLKLLYVRNESNQLIPLNTLANLSPGVGPLSVNHVGQMPSVTLSFNLAPGVALGDATERVRQAAAELLPQSIAFSAQGSAQAFQQSLTGLGLLLLMAILVIYIILGILYESFVHPLTILSGLPSAAFGALVALLWFGMELNIYGFVGLIMLIGIVKKNAIMMIDFALDAQRTENLSAAEAIYQGCLIRFRPIMMTTMAAIMGTLPIALGHGAGADVRRPLGIAVVGGLVVSQLLTLYITPVVYIYMEKIFGAKKAKVEEMQPVRVDEGEAQVIV